MINILTTQLLLSDQKCKRHPPTHIYCCQCCEQDQVLKTRTTRPELTRPRPRLAFRTMLFIQYTYCSSSKQFPFSVFKRLLYLTYSKCDITVLTVSTTELHVCLLRINTQHILQRIRMHSLS